VLAFRREAPLTAGQQIAFTTNFGQLEPPYTQIQSPEGKRLDNPALSDISNLVFGRTIDVELSCRTHPTVSPNGHRYRVDVTNGARGQSFFDRGEHVTIGSEPTWICSLLLCLTRLLVAYRILRLRKTVIRE